MRGDVNSAAAWLAALVLAVLAASPACTQPAAGDGEGAPAPATAAQAKSGEKEWSFGRMPLRFSPGKGPLAIAMKARAASEADAQELVDAVLAGGPGCAVQAQVTIEFFLAIDVTGGFLCVRSSLRGDFDTFAIDVGEDRLSDLATGTNAEITRPGNGWTTITARLPSARLPAGATARLTQHRVGAPADEVTRFSVGF